MGASLKIVTIFLQVSASSLDASKFSLSFPLSERIFSKIPSTLLYSHKYLTAFFIPIPGTPEILSDLSPIKAFKSIN